MKKIINVLGLSLVSIIGLANANEKTGDLKSSATMQATCSISVNQIGFGAIATPLLAQSAQSEMSVKCSNTSAYTIDLAYGGIYGQGSSNSDYSIQYQGSTARYNQYNIYNSSNVSQGYMVCGFSGNIVGQVTFNNSVSANLYGYSTINIWLQDTKGACQTNGTQVGTYPKGWTGDYNSPSKQGVGGDGYDYGVMSGMTKGDKLAYSIQVPGDASKVWNKGNNSYSSKGNGDNQTILLNAKIVPEKSGSKYPAPDMYLDTVTAVISY